MKEKLYIIEITGVKNVCSSDTNLLRAQWMSPTILTPQINFSQGEKILEIRLKTSHSHCQPPITISVGFKAKKIHTLIVSFK